MKDIDDLKDRVSDVPDDYEAGEVEFEADEQDQKVTEEIRDMDASEKWDV